VGNVDLGVVGKLFVLAGAILAGVGLLLVLVSRGWVPRLPGDLSFTVGNVRVFFPVVSSLVLSLVLTLIFSLIARR
jgi:uncharacterized membrane protein